ncbi:hypothetical protein GW17_00052695 [Ensete ventricosum]|nr:hypothetical protein GW17_00052695 [Ensete ventricosum]
MKRGQPAKPPARAAGHGQAPCRGGHPRPSWLWPRTLARGRLDAARASPQESSPIERPSRKGLPPPASPATSRAAPTRATPVQVREEGVGSHRLRRGDGGDTVRVREEG